jgi:hypothetical protein
MEAVERRGEPRGLVRDLAVTMQSGTRVAVLEASRKGFFVVADDPDSFKLGATEEIHVHQGDREIGCRTEVVRKEIHPRKGIALRIMHIAPVAEETLKQMLEG